MFEEIFERIKIATNTKSQKDVAKILNTRATTITEAKRRDKVPDSWFTRLYQSHGINIGWLLDGTGPMHAKELPPREQSTFHESSPSQLAQQSDYKEQGSTPARIHEPVIPQWKAPDHEMFAYVPLVSTRLSAGDGAFVLSEDVVGYYAFRKDWLRRTTSGINNVVLAMLSGNSMMPTLKEKDFVMIDLGQTHITDDLIYAIRIDDTVMIKRLRRRPREIIKIVSDNRDEYESYETAQQDVHVIGQVIWSCRSYLTSI